MNVMQLQKSDVHIGGFHFALACVATFFATQLPGTVAKQFFDLAPNQTLWLQVVVLAVSLLIAFTYWPASPLRGYFLLISGIMLAENFLRPFIAGSAVWQWGFTDQSGSLRYELGVQLIRLLPSLIAWMMLVVMGFSRRETYLCIGELNAPAEPVRWLRIQSGDRWKKTGLSFLFMITLITMVITLQVNGPLLSSLPRVIPWIPAVLIFAALNAFNENFFNRAALLPVLLPVFGKSQSLLLSTLFFSLGHLNFTQMGPTGFLFAALLGWILGKSMIETRGFAWAWLIQFPNDVLAITFVFLSLYAV